MMKTMPWKEEEEEEERIGRASRDSREESLSRAKGHSREVRVPSRYFGASRKGIDFDFASSFATPAVCVAGTTNPVAAPSASATMTDCILSVCLDRE